MSDTVIQMPNGDRYSPSSSTDVIQCANCSNVVETEAEAKSYAADGNCPECGNSWSEKRSTTITVAMYESLGGGTM